jgi:predicted DNA-binding protein (UPF0251 family)
MKINLPNELLFTIFAANNSLIKMSPRLKRPRKILSPPPIKGFKPYGVESGLQDSGPVNLLFEEYESLRLSDYDHLNHHKASVLMGVSRPTFTRIYAAALQKIALAFVEGRQIAIAGGKVYFDSDWYECDSCRCYFNNPHKDVPIQNCPLCGSKHVQSLDLPVENSEKTEYEDLCICPKCHNEQKHIPGEPCNQQICHKCGSFMNRKGAKGHHKIQEL